MRFHLRLACILACLMVAGSFLSISAQTGTGSIHGTVVDPSGAAVVNATVAAITPDGQAKTTTTSRSGYYEIKGLVPGTYTLTVSTPGFADFVQDNLNLAAGQSQLLDVSLAIAVEKEKVNVTDQAGAGVDTNPASNAGAIILSGKDLDALPDDPDELQTDLEALAGPSAGPNGGQMYKLPVIGDLAEKQANAM